MPSIKYTRILIPLALILNSCSVTMGVNQTINTDCHESYTRSWDYRSLLNDTVFWEWNRPDFPAFECEMPCPPQGEIILTDICMPIGYFYYPDGEVIYIECNRIVRDISLVELKGDNLSSPISRKSHGYYYNGPFEDCVVTQIDYIDPYNGQSGIVNYYLSDEIEYVWKDIKFNMEVNNQYHDAGINIDSYMPIENRKTFCFIKDDILVVLYNIKPENFARYYRVLSTSLTVHEIHGSLFTIHKKSFCRGWKAIRVGD